MFMSHYATEVCKCPQISHIFVLRKIQITAICVLYIIHVILPIKNFDIAVNYKLFKINRL